MLGIFILVVSLAAGGVEQGMKLNDPSVAFADSTRAMLMFLRVEHDRPVAHRAGQLVVRPEYFCDDHAWKWSVAKTVFAAVTAPLEKSEVKA